jgi:GNAT superfamily N-acetyltransferase
MMLDYTLVTTKATYRPLNPVDIPAFIRLVTRRHREELSREALPPERVLAFLEELHHHKDRGALLVFEVEESLAGYALLRPRWCTDRGGPELAIEELYVVPEQRAREIAADFLELLRKVAPQDIRRILLEAPRADRKGMDACRKLGFKDTGRVILSLDVEGDKQ